MALEGELGRLEVHCSHCECCGRLAHVFTCLCEEGGRELKRLLCNYTDACADPVV